MRQDKFSSIVIKAEIIIKENPEMANFQFFRKIDNTVDFIWTSRGCFQQQK